MSNVSENTIEAMQTTISGVTIVCPSEAPSFYEYMTVASTDVIVMLSIFGFSALLLLVNYVEEINFLYKFDAIPRLSRDRAKWLLAIYPLIATTEAVSLFSPRTAGLNNLVNAIFVAVCVYIFVLMLIDQFHGPASMMASLAGSIIRLNPRPICCCICCPKKPFNKVGMQVLYVMVLQFVLIRPFVAYGLGVLVTDGSYNNANKADQSPSNYVDVVYAFSTLLAMWSFAIIFDLCKKPLSDVHITPKFFCLQLVLVIVGLQQSIISAFQMAGLIVCDPPLPAQTVAQRLNSMITIAEMFLLAIAARIFYRHKIRVDQELKRRDTLTDGGTSVLFVRTESRFSLQNGGNDVGLAGCGSSKCDGDDTMSNGRNDAEHSQHGGTCETTDGACVVIRL